MAKVIVSTEINRSRAEVWADVRDIASHVDWMADAAEIRFVSEQIEGIGTVFECDTRVGPLSTTDVMEITAWDEGEVIGVRHKGIVTGEGAFTLVEMGPDKTEFRWEEDLSFPWWLGGQLVATASRPILRAIWKRNLTKLRKRLEAPAVDRDR